MTRLSLTELDLDPELDPDPGTSWHPRPDKAEARAGDGHLVDLDDDQVAVHQAKPEAADQPDAGRPLAAEDSTTTPDQEV